MDMYFRDIVSKTRFTFFSTNYFDTHNLTILAQNTWAASHNYEEKLSNHHKKRPPLRSIRS